MKRLFLDFKCWSQLITNTRFSGTMVVLGITCLILVLSCKKDISEINALGEGVYSLSGLPSITVDNGMLSFSNPNDIQATLDYLREAESTQAKIDSAYASIGITPAMRDSTIRYTDHPVCKKFETDLGFTSQRSYEEYDIFDKMDNGDSLNSIVDNPYFKTLQNQFGCLKVGNRIIKAFPSGTRIIIGNNDYNLYNSVKALDENQISESYNLRITGIIDSINNEFYTKIDSPFHLTTNYVKDIKFVSTLNDDSTITISNSTFIEYSDGSQPTYQYLYSNQTTSSGIQPTQTIGYLDSLRVIIGNSGNGYDTAFVYPRYCAINNIHIWNLGGNRFYFRLNHYAFPDGGRYSLSTGGQIEWDFGDGSPVIYNSEHVHTYAITGNYTVTASIVSYPNGIRYVWCYKSAPVVVSCPTRHSTKEDNQKYNTSDGEYRLDVKIWIDQNFMTTGNVGSRSKTLRYNNFLKAYFTRSVNRIWTALEGLYNRSSGPCMSVYIPQNVGEFEDNSGNVQVNIDDPFNPSSSPNDLFSTHGFRLNGTTYTYTKNNSKLVLP